MYSIALCDDDTDFAARFRDQLARTLDGRGLSYRLEVFSDPEALLRSITGGQRFSLLFLDVIYAQAEQGIRLAATLRRAGYEVDIVFMSTTGDFAAASFDVAPLHYLLKPVAQEKLDAALDRFLERNAPRTLRLNTARGMLQVRLSDVVYFEIYAHEIVIHKKDGARDSCVGTLKQLEAALPPGSFVRPHRSYLVNLDHIHKIVRYQVFLSNGETAPVSKSLYQQVQQAFIDHADRRDRTF